MLAGNRTQMEAYRQQALGVAESMSDEDDRQQLLEDQFALQTTNIVAQQRLEAGLGQLHQL